MDEEPRTSREPRDADDGGPVLLLTRCRLGGVGPVGVLVTYRPEPWPVWRSWLRRLGPDNWLAWWGPLPSDAPHLDPPKTPTEHGPPPVDQADTPHPSPC